ncbi:MAG: 4-hydroxy-tetrahydrodipicolinate synthase [Pseudomonadota bacterium]
MTKKFTGTTTALVTPFNDDLSIDNESLKKLIEYQINGNISNILLSGTTGEGVTLETEELVDLIKTSKEVIKDRVPVIVGSGSNSTSKTISNSKIANEAGADALLVVGPYYNKPTQNGYYEHFKACASEVNIPIIIYNVPSRTGGNIDPATIIKLSEIDNIVGVKEASGNLNQMMEIKKYTNEDFIILSGEDSLTFPMLTLGGDGVISVVSNQIPEQFSNMVSKALTGNLEIASQIHYKYLELMKINFVESNPIPVKYALYKMGLCKENYRLPLVKLQKVNKEKVDNCLKELELILD